MTYRVRMNRILFESPECRNGWVTLRDHRADHLRRVLRARPGDVFRVGVVNGAAGEGEVTGMREDGITLKVMLKEPPVRPPLDLLLALPRPKVLRRLLPQIAALGVDRLFLTNAMRVERHYFDTHVLTPEPLRQLLVEGLTQSGGTWLPQVQVARRLKVFVEDELENASDAEERILLHPGADTRWADLPPPGERTFLAIGPEGGWVDFERALFAGRGFQSARLTAGVLRSDTACIVALGAAVMRLNS